ncbi:MAG: DUF3307 domain-containing protein [Chloroflexota bacterium]|nr:MAG: DUF3307 domain-containing protein [Chloroflexota bacterium]
MKRRAMILAMLLAHLFGDYILQWDNLSKWKSKRLSGVLLHGLIVTGVTLIFAVLIEPSWWPWAIFIGLTHTLIDALQLPIRRHMASQKSGKGALALFAADQTAHLTIIALVLIWSGYLEAPSLTDGVIAASYDNKFLAFALGYAFLTMPAWIIIRFFICGFMNGTAPDFSMRLGGKYSSMLERGLILTLVLFGQFILIPLATLPRLIMEWSQPVAQPAGHQAFVGRRGLQYMAELLVGVALAVTIGLALRQL